MGVVNGCGLELIVFKHTCVNVNKIDHTHGACCVLMNIKILQKTGPASLRPWAMKLLFTSINNVDSISEATVDFAEMF